MKRFFVSFLIALIAAPVSAQAETVRVLDDVASDVQVVAAAFWQDGPPANRRNRNRDRDNNDGGNRGGNNLDRDNSRDNDRPRREDRNGDGMQQAYRMASRYGRVIDVWPEGGSRFGASVSGSRGKIELRIDVATGDVREK